ncbi:hypothetical protein GEMRC1_000947 [Eukaryota sp. GEM-RC1]
MLSLSSIDQPNSIPIELNYYLVAGSRKFSDKYVGLLFDDILDITVENLTTLLMSHYSEVAARLRKEQHPEASLEISFRISNNFGKEVPAQFKDG